MDIAKVKPQEAIHEILHPGNDQKLGIIVGILSLDDEAMKKIKRQINNERINLEKRGKAFDSDKIDANVSLLIFKAMTGWTWQAPLISEATETTPAVYGEAPTFHGEIPTFNQSNVFRVFDELPWFRDQLLERVGETKSFFPT